MDGIELLQALQGLVPDASVIVITAYGTIESAVQAMRAGAYDFIEKPFSRMRLLQSVRKAIERHVLLSENRILKAEIHALRGRG
ncbi:MAG: response regulator, partial [Deltaproteobacteria bacterium]|nr:response regulator [Deltaproteobacteria bacterium]